MSDIETSYSSDEDVYVPPFTSFAEILAYYHSYLEGMIDSCPTHAGPLEEESNKILSQLLKINEFGILTVDSQPGSTIKLPDDPSGHHRKIKQRAYLDCYMPKRMYQYLKKKFLDREFLIFGQPCTAASAEAPQMTVPVTVTKYTYKYKCYIDVCSAMPVNWISEDMELILSQTNEVFADQIIENLYSVRFLDPIWNRETNLFDRIIKCLEAY